VTRREMLEALAIDSWEDLVPKPNPVHVNVICSECGLSWDAHGPRPTLDDCVRLLRAELARRPVVVNHPLPWPVVPYRPWWDRTSAPYFSGTRYATTCSGVETPGRSTTTLRAVNA